MAQTLQKIGKYEVVEVLGKGGMGVVYKAVDPRIGRQVAIKMMTGGFAENPDLLKRFYREAQSTGMLQHPNIVIVYDLGDQEGNPYLVMEYLEGEPLDKIISSKREVSMVEKLGFIIQACTGLNYAHQKGIVHRDIKPANLMVLKNGDCKIVDFGIARVGDNSMTRTGQVVGTITYMSPEQINAQVVDGRSDIFSAGVMLYELLTGILPFEGKDTASTLLKIIHEPPPPLSKYLETYPKELDEVILRALAKDREERYATAEDFGFDLGRVQEAIKKTMVSDYVARAKQAVEKSDLPKAKEILQVVLKVDTQHSVAKELMAEVQSRMQRQQRSEQIRQLRSHAEEAMSQKMLDDALAYAEQALSLDKTNSELQDLRNVVAAAKQKKDKVDSAIGNAEKARANGDLEAAVKMLADAIAVDPDHSKAKTLHATFTKELSESSKQKQMQGFIDEARRDISARKFTAAFEVLKKAEAIDSSSPEVMSLLNLANSGREQEHKRKELEKYTSEIESALAKDDYQGALKQAEEGLKRFTNDPALLKMKALAEKQREAGEKKKFVEEQMAAARKLLEASKAAEALDILNKAAQKVPGDTKLKSFINMVREAAESEKTEAKKATYIAQAKDAIGHKDYKAAVKVLEMAQNEIEGSSEIADLLQFARDEATSTDKRKKVDSAAAEAQRFIAENDYEQAVAVLEQAIKQYPDEELKVVLTEARHGLQEFNQKVENTTAKAKKLMEMRKVDEAVALLEGNAKDMGRSSAFASLLEKARGEQDQVKGVKDALDKARQALEKNDFNNALKIMEACKKTYGEIAEVKQAFTDFETKKTSMAKTGVDKALRDARALLLARQYLAALNSLEAVSPLISIAPPELQKQYEQVKKDASAGASRQQKEVDLSKTIVAGSTDMSQTMIAGSTDVAAARSGTMPAARVPARQPVVAPPPPPKSKTGLIIGVVAAVLVVGAVVGYLKFAAPAKPTTYIEINAVPWGTVKSVDSVDGSVKISVNQETPVRVPVPPGDYNVTFETPDGKEQVEKVEHVTDQAPGSTMPLFVDGKYLESIVEQH
jgi:eukaryotic-like serine/threonine-protein kinase